MSGKGAPLVTQNSSGGQKGVARRRDRNARWLGKPASSGCFPDYGNPRGEIITGLDAPVRKHYPDIEKLRYGLRMELQELRVL